MLIACANTFVLGNISSILNKTLVYFAHSSLNVTNFSAIKITIRRFFSANNLDIRRTLYSFAAETIRYAIYTRLRKLVAIPL